MINHQKTDSHQDMSKSLLGFWIYLMTDLVLFASLFATFAVLKNNTAGGPAGKDLFSMPFVLTETLILLASSYTAGLAMIAAQKKQKNLLFAMLGLTFLLGAVFLGMELYEFNHLIHEGYSWKRSAFLSAFFTLIGTHGLHITAGLIWLMVIVYQIKKRGLTFNTTKRLALFSMFWHFLDIVWIFIFTFVYLIGVL